MLLKTFTVSIVSLIYIVSTSYYDGTTHGFYFYVNGNVTWNSQDIQNVSATMLSTSGSYCDYKFLKNTTHGFYFYVNGNVTWNSQDIQNVSATMLSTKNFHLSINYTKSGVTEFLSKYFPKDCVNNKTCEDNNKPYETKKDCTCELGNITLS
uniref:Secreted protein n=1 Tax=Strongyloides papillosus TaxID=174720 RepID=A0A0N5CIR0_STREA